MHAFLAVTISAFYDLAEARAGFTSAGITSPPWRARPSVEQIVGLPEEQREWRHELPDAGSGPQAETRPRAD